MTPLLSRPPGCGFLDTAEALVELGADVNSRDVTMCTPLQNAAHGTYSALAAMPALGVDDGSTLNGARRAMSCGVQRRSRASACRARYLRPWEPIWHARG